MNNQQWINNMDEKTLRALIRKHPGAIKYVDRPSFSIAKLVIDRDVDCIDLSIQLCEKSQQYLITCYPDMFHLIRNPSMYIIGLALELRPANIQYVENPTDEQLITAFSSNPRLIELFSNEKLKYMSDYVKSYVKIIT